MCVQNSPTSNIHRQYSNSVIMYTVFCDFLIVSVTSAEGQDVMPEFKPSRTGYYFYLFPRVQDSRQKSPHLTYCLALFDYF